MKNIYLTIGISALLLISNHFVKAQIHDGEESSTLNEKERAKDTLGNKEFNDAEYYRDRHNNEKAIELYNLAISKNGKIGKYHQGKGRSLIELYQLESAITSFEKATKLDKKDQFSFEMLGNLYTETRKTKKAIKNYEKAYELEEDKEYRLTYTFEIIKILYDLKNYDDARIHLDHAKEIHPKNIDYRFLEAKYQNQKKNYKEAIKLIEGILAELHTTDTQWLARFNYELGYAYHYDGQYQKGAEFLKKADVFPYKQKVKELSGRVYYGAAKAYFAIRNKDFATKLINIALAIEPANVDYKKLKSQMEYYRLNGAEISYKISENEAKLKETDSEEYSLKLHKKLLLEYLAMRQYEDAKVSADYILGRNPKSLKVNFYKVLALFYNNEVNEAERLLSSMMKTEGLDSKHKSEFAFMLGYIKQHTKDSEKKANKYYMQVKSSYFKAGAIIAMKGLISE